ncbi:unnamed protein product, partial [Prorocentrum cordatum]
SLVLLAAVRRRGRAAADSSGRAGPVQVVGRLYRLPGLAHEQAAARVLPASESGRHAGPAARQGRVAPDRPRRARAAAAGPGRRGGGALAAGPPAGAELVRGRPLHGVFPPEAGGTRGGLGGGRPGGPHGEFARRQVAPRDRRPERAGPPLTAVLSAKGTRATEFNFYRLACLKPGQVCTPAEVAGEDDAEERDDL